MGAQNLRLTCPKGESPWTGLELSDMVLQLQQNQARLEQENQVLRESQGGVTMLASAVGELAKSL